MNNNTIKAAAELQTEPEADRRRSGSGSFSAPRGALIDLVENEVSSAVICAYLIICAFTDRSGELSTTGLKGILTRLNVNRETAHKLVQQLVDLGLILDKRPQYGEGESARRAVRFQVLTFNEPRDKQVWFCMSLVLPSETGLICDCPISRLKRLTTACAYTFLWLHAEQDDFTMSVRLPYQARRDPGAAFIYNYQHNRGGEWFDDSTGNRVVGYASEKQLVAFQTPHNCDIENSLDALMKNGFAYETIVVLDRPIKAWSDESNLCVDDEASFQYTLWTPKTGAGKLMDVERGLALNQKETWDSEDKSCIFGEVGRFQRTYFVASPRGMAVAVVGLIRLRHRVHNSRNLHVSEGWSRLSSVHRSYIGWMDRIRHHYL